MRLFAAVLPPPEAVEHLDEFLSCRRDAAPFRWTAPEQVHLTLAFMAEVEQWRLDDLVEGLNAAVARRTSVRVRIAGGGAFPHPDAAKVLWAGLDLDPQAGAELTQLSAGARTAATRAGIAVDGQRFRPHLTVARTGRPLQVSRWVQLLDGYRGPTWTTDTVSLVHSHLGEGPRGRPRYDVLAELECRGHAVGLPRS